MALSFTRQGAPLFQDGTRAICLSCQSRMHTKKPRLDPSTAILETRRTFTTKYTSTSPRQDILPNPRRPSSQLQFSEFTVIRVNNRHLHTTSIYGQKQKQKQAKPGPDVSSSDTAKSASIAALEKDISSKKKPHVRARDGELVPKTLQRPLGLPYPPESGQNTGIDTRSWRQLRDDFVSYDKHLERREGLVKELYEKNYFRDLGNIGRVYKGKSMIGPKTPVRKDYALWFPNLKGYVIGPGVKGEMDTTPLMAGKVTILKLFSTHWGIQQTETLTSSKDGCNPPLAAYLERLDAQTLRPLQVLPIMYEENWLKFLMMRLFAPRHYRQSRLKGSVATNNAAYVRRGLSDAIREALGIWNLKVGYVYLLDAQCRVRWASNGDASEEEKDSFVRCLGRLLDEEASRGKS